MVFGLTLKFIQLLKCVPSVGIEQDTEHQAQYQDHLKKTEVLLASPRKILYNG